MTRCIDREIAAALNVASLARLTLAGRRRGEGFWVMPHGASCVRLCWQNNMDRARRLRATRVTNQVQA